MKSNGDFRMLMSMLIHGVVLIYRTGLPQLIFLGSIAKHATRPPLEPKFFLFLDLGRYEIAQVKATIPLPPQNFSNIGDTSIAIIAIFLAPWAIVMSKLKPFKIMKTNLCITFKSKETMDC